MPLVVETDSIRAVQLLAQDVVCLVAEEVYVDVILAMLQTNQVVVTHVLSEVYSVTPFKISIVCNVQSYCFG